MTTWLAIPIKSIRDGKTRLAPTLDPAQRSAFMDALLVHTLKQAAQFPGLGHTLVVSACDETRKRAEALGARVLTETGCELNAAVKQAQTKIREFGATRMLVIPCDLPLLCAEDLQFLSQRLTHKGIVIAPDRSLRGTNGLCLDAASDFTFEFGTNSFARHKQGALRLQLAHTIAQRPGLSFDVDTPQDLTELYQHETCKPFSEAVSTP